MALTHRAVARLPCVRSATRALRSVAYTALSRMRTLAGAFIKNLTLSHLQMVSEKAKDWYEGLSVESCSRD